MDDLERWAIEREVFKKWLEKRDFFQLLNVADDISNQLERERTKLKTDHFTQMMRKEFGV